LGRGGAEILLPEMYIAHDKEKYEFGFGYYLPWKNQVAEVLKGLGASVYCFNASNNVILLLKTWHIARFLEKWKATILHCHLPWAGFAGRLVGQLTGIPVVYTEHNKQERYHWITRWLNRVTFSAQNGVIAVSKEVEDSIHKNIGSRTPVEVIVNGVDPLKFSRDKRDRVAMRNKLGISDDVKIIGIVAVFRTQKRLDLWIETAAEILKKFRNAQFVIVGEGPCRPIIEQKIKELGLGKFIHLPGLQPDTRPFYAAFDLFLMTSEFEGLPVALLEAMAMSCPIVATRAGGISEVVRHETDGLLFPVYTTSVDLALGCVSLLSDDSRASRFSTNARARILEGYTMAMMARRMESFYETILAPRV
jgi:glycosyltransferase involved in cell wall biosynthesis